MGLEILDNGYIKIGTKKDAIQALENLRDLKAELVEVKAEAGIDDLEKDIVAYSAGIRDFMVGKNIDQLQGEGFHGTLVKGSGGTRWITTDDDLSGDEIGTVQSLQTIIEKKFKSGIDEKGSKARKVWMKITKRVLDKEALDVAVDAGILKTEDVASAMVEISRAPYVRIFSDE